MNQETLGSEKRGPIKELLTKEAIKANLEGKRAAELVFITTARHQLIDEKVTRYEREILKRHQWSPSKRFRRMASKRRGRLEPVILDPKNAYLVDADSYAFKVFIEAIERARVRAKLSVSQPGNCPRSEAQMLMIEARRHLVDTMAPATGIRFDDVLYKDQDRLVDMLLGMFAPFVDAQAKLDELAGRVSPGARE